MAKVVFMPNIQRHVACPETEAAGRTVRKVLEAVFVLNPDLRSYVLDDQAALRKHMTIFTDAILSDQVHLSDPVTEVGRPPGAARSTAKKLRLRRKALAVGDFIGFTA